MKIWNFVAAGALGLVLATLALTPSSADESRSKLPSRHPPLSLNSAAKAISGSDALIGRGNAGMKTLKSRPHVGAGVMAERRTALLDDIRQMYARRQTRSAFADLDDERRASMQVITAHKAEKGAEVRVSKSTGAATFLRKGALPIVSASIPVPESEQEALMGFLTQHKALFQMQLPDRQLALARHRTDPYGKRHYLYQQNVNSVPVYGAQVLAHFDSEGGMYALTARTRQIPTSFETTPGLTGSEVEEIVRGKFVTVGSISIEPELQIRVENPRHPRLVYAVTSIVDNVNRWTTIIDAKTGRILKHYKDHREANAASSGLDLHGATRNFNTWYDDSVYYMVDVATPVLTGSEDPLNVTSQYGDTIVLDLRNGDSSAYHVVSGSAASGWDPAAVSAIHNVQSAYRYFFSAHGRLGIDGNNGNIFAYIHYGAAIENAFWMGNGMVFGDGGSSISNLAGCLDIVGHEMAHGVISSTANLIYANQSGALNESIADFFGTMVEDSGWLLGEDCVKTDPGFSRSMIDPHAGFPKQPAHMSEYVYLPNTEAGDHGGVHYNSGIPNRAAYLLAEGLAAEGVGASIGRAKTEALYYRTLTTYLVSSSQFIDLRRGMLLAAADLYPGDGTVEQAINDAFDAVGISEGNIGAPDDTSPTEADVLAGSDLLLYLYPVDEVYDGAENFQLWMQQLDDPFTGYDSLADVGPLNADYTVGTRPAAFTDEYGTVALYVGADRNLYWNVGGAVSQLTSDGWMWSVAVSDNGRRVAYTVNDETDNGIYVFDPQSGDVLRYELELVDYVSGSVDAGARILYADALDFNYLGNRIAFDAFVCIPTADVSCDAPLPFGYWTIGVLDVNTGNVHYPFNNQAANLNLGYPTFAHNNEYIIAFDMVEYLDDGSIGTATFTFNTETNEFPGNGVDRAVNSPGPAMWGVPTFLGDDSALILQGLIDSDVGTGYVRISTVKLELMSDFAIDFAAPLQRMNNYDAAFPIIHRAVYRDLGSVGLDPSKERLDFGDVEPGKVVETSFTLTNNSSADVIIYQSDIANNSFSHSLINTRVPRGESVSGTVRFLGSATEGTYIGGLQIQTDASQAGFTIDLIATVVPESDDSDDNDRDEDDDTPGSDNGGNLGNTNGDSGGGGGGGPLLWLSLVPLIIGLRREYRRL